MYIWGPIYSTLQNHCKKLGPYKNEYTKSCYLVSTLFKSNLVTLELFHKRQAVGGK